MKVVSVTISKYIIRKILLSITEITQANVKKTSKRRKYFKCQLCTNLPCCVNVFILYFEYVFVRRIFNTFRATGLLLHPRETSENYIFSDVLRGYRKRSMA